MQIRQPSSLFLSDLGKNTLVKYTTANFLLFNKNLLEAKKQEVIQKLQGL